MKDGTINIINLKKWKFVKKFKHSKEEISDIKFSPNNKYCAIGSHDNKIYIYKTKTWKKKSKRPLNKHSSYITHIDWSTNSKFLHSNCGAYEILFWNVESGLQLPGGATDLRDEDW